MEDQLWNLFLETGDPMGYLLYKAGEKSGNAGGQEKKEKQPKDGKPQASV